MASSMQQYSYLFAAGAIFASLDAFMIGANDVANAFATSVASRSLTMKQACLAAAICEFLGAVLVGARVADTIKNGIISSSIFQGNAGVQLLAFTVAIMVSSLWLTTATRMGWPVSTTYSIVSAVAGVGVALGGSRSVNWGWNNGKGLATIFAGFIIAPGISAGFAAATFLGVKYIVLVRKNPIKWGLATSPAIFFLVAAVLTLSIVFKGSPSLGLDELSQAGIAAAVCGSGAVVALLSAVFWLPFVRAKVVKKDYTVRWYHFFVGPVLWFRDPPADAGTIGTKAVVPDYAQNIVRSQAHAAGTSSDHSSLSASDEGNSASIEEKGEDITEEKQAAADSAHKTEAPVVDLHPIVGAWAEPKNLWIIVRYKVYPYFKNILTYGSTVDIHGLQAGEAGSRTHERMESRNNAVTSYPNEVEHLYSFLQVLTACTASFAHGANDVANAIGPFSVIYSTFTTGAASGSDTPVPVWILAAGAAFLVLGLATYGYNIMRVLGNNITPHSPSRGFSMELGAAITVILASQYGLPVSTTMCITGATMGVALCNGDFRATNWRALGMIFLGWVLTVPVVGTLSGCVMAIILYAPNVLPRTVV